jgi:transposase-like protein
VAKLREAERLQGQGMTVAQVCRRIGVSGRTFFRWRVRYGVLVRPSPLLPRGFPRKHRGVNQTGPTPGIEVRVTGSERGKRLHRSIASRTRSIAAPGRSAKLSQRLIVRAVSET